MTDWRSSGEDWKDHDAPYWKKALRTARDNDWWFQPFSGHSFGVVACRTDPEDRCALAIFSTGVGSESWAHALEKKVARCPHRPRPTHRTTAQRAIDEAAAALDAANRLVAAANDCLDAGKAQERSAELFEFALAVLDAAQQQTEAWLSEAASLEAGAQAVFDHVRDLAEELRLDPHHPPTASSLTREAESLADEASGRLSRETKGKNWPALRVLRARIADLRDQIAKLRDN